MISHMSEINLPLLSELTSKKIGREIKFVGIQNIGTGYHSDGFKLSTQSGEEFFLKYIKSHDLGLEFPERKAMTLMVSTAMGQRAGEGNPLPIGVIVVNDEDGVVLPELNEQSEIYHLQEFGGTGKSYSSILSQNSNKNSVDEEDEKQLSAIADALVKIHTIKHSSQDRKQIDAIYNDGIRNMLTHPELFTMVLSEFPSDYPILDLEGQKELISLVYENMKTWMGRGDRLTALHGDFWGANIFFREDKSLFIIDFSRIPWGDPAIDAGWFTAEYLWKYHETGNPYFKQLTETWLNVYEQKSGDHEVRKAMCLVMGWVGIVQVYPRWFPNLDVEVGRKFMAHIKKILKHKEFVWND